MKRIVLFTIVFTVLGTASFAQPERIKAVFIYKFAQYIEWPSKASMDHGDFVIMVAGDAALQQQLEALLNGRSVHDREIVVRSYQPNAETQAHLLYVGPDYQNELSQFRSVASDEHVVLVTETGNGLQGAHLNFVPNGNRMEFEIDSPGLEMAGLRVQASLRSLARN